MAATYKLIDMTKIIPEIYYNHTLDNLLIMLKETHCENIEHRHKIYITVQYGAILYGIIFSDGTTLYELNNNGIQKFNEKKPLDEKKVIEIEKFLKNEKKVSFKSMPDTTEIDFIEDIIPLENINKNESKDNNENNKSKDDNENNKNDDNETSIDILKECEKLMEPYEKEKERKKTLLSTKLKLEKKEAELLKLKNDKIQDKIIKAVGNYKTYQNIIKTPNAITPMFFTTQYEYFNNLCDEDKEILGKVNDLDILNAKSFDEQLIRVSTDFDNSIKKVINKNTVLFEHEWSELNEDVQNIKLNV